MGDILHFLWASCCHNHSPSHFTTKFDLYNTLTPFTAFILQALESHNPFNPVNNIYFSNSTYINKIQTPNKVNQNKPSLTNPCTLHIVPWDHPGYKASHICNTFKTQTTKKVQEKKKRKAPSVPKPKIPIPTINNLKKY